MIRVLEQNQLLPISLDTAWDFFSSPHNLDLITPPELRFRIVDLDSATMYEGQLIRYRIRVAPLVWTGWTTEIIDVDPGVSFTDNQVRGPYKLWRHKHIFEPTEDGGVEMTDQISYEVGFGLIGEVAHAAFVGRRLKYIFDYRKKKLDELFSEPAGKS